MSPMKRVLQLLTDLATSPSGNEGGLLADQSADGGVDLLAEILDGVHQSKGVVIGKVGAGLGCGVTVLNGGEHIVGGRC